MELQYILSREDYTKTIEFAIRQRSKTPLRLIFLVITTIGQMCVVVWYQLVHNLNFSQRLLLGSLSLLVAAVNISYLFFTRFRAKTLLSSMEEANMLSADYWEPHHLHLSDDVLILRYSNIEHKLPCSQISQILQTKELTLIFCGQAVFEAIPHRQLTPETVMAFFQSTVPSDK